MFLKEKWDGKWCVGVGEVDFGFECESFLVWSECGDVVID